MNKKFLCGFSIVLVTMLISACGLLPQTEQQTTSGDSPHTIRLAEDSEPGQPLTIYATVVDSLTGEPVPNASVYLYHADADGEYLPSDPGDESTAKLSGEVVTSETGQFTVYTIVPREYDMPGNRHIHIHYVRAVGYEQLGGVILFEDDVNNEVRQWAKDTGFGIIIELTENDGSMEGILTLPLVPE